MRSLARRIDRLEAAMIDTTGMRGAGQIGGGGSSVRFVRNRNRGPLAPPLQLRFGNLRRLPAGYQGERHVIVAKHLPMRNGQEWVEFEEVAGPEPSPPPPDSRLPNCLNIVFVGPPGEDEGSPE